MRQVFAGEAPQLGLDGIAAPAPARVAVLLCRPIPGAGAYDYAVPAEMALSPGDVVVVPLGPQRLVGVVWDAGTALTADSGRVAASKLKPVAAQLPVPPIPPRLRRFVEFVANYTLSAPGAVLRMVLSSTSALQEEKPVPALLRVPGAELPRRLTPARARVLEVFAERPEGAALPRAELIGESGASGAVLDGLVAAGVLQAVELAGDSGWPDLDLGRGGPVLGPEQAAAAAALGEAVRSGGFGVTLLDGVTGSGKTEVYFDAIAEAVKAGRQALVLLPEIALSPQWLERFRRRFGAEPVVWHSSITPAKRRRAWRAVAQGRASVVVGARSALFLPFPELGLIVVDEEHEHAFKQEDQVVYHARDMAVARAHAEEIPVALISATPSLETVWNIRQGRYRSLPLPVRHGGAVLPEVSLVDLRVQQPPRGGFLSPPLRQALQEALEAGDQSLLFLNRRGYAPLTLCRGCGFRLQCPNCSAWLIEHRFVPAHREGRLQCHHCGHRASLPDACPNCNEEGKFTPCGPGIERVAEELAALLPEARVETVSSDTVHSPEAMADLVQRMAERKVDVLIGTQMLAKGHHFPLLTLVGVVDADLGLSGGDPRAAERTFQLLSQVAGRAGRGERPGRVLMQTYQPENAVLQALAAHDRDGFIAAEMLEREQAGFPPFTRMVGLIVSGEDEAAVMSASAALGRAAPQGDAWRVLGPAPAVMALLRGQHRRRLLLIAERRIHVQALVADWLAAVPLPSSIRIRVDVDPISFM